ncbi:AtpZ/AtpI family protein [Polaribacter sp. PL03]|uniref:AtpZ/AtpI family protein n=1 Tax=Polaribacter sp. PL03 TaxID=3088353 RepID=UPI0029D0A794|nr:AtpZ/AtpI family protein [Polaribacter sp. PL03]MDX6745595.1 AtpZ/AtpI family protein [Polaribacter sp. PL03]
MKQKNVQKKPLNKAIQLSGAGLQMGLTIYLGFLLGEWLDKKLELTFLTTTVTLIAIFLATYALIKQANRIND